MSDKNIKNNANKEKYNTCMKSNTKFCMILTIA